MKFKHRVRRGINQTLGLQKRGNFGLPEEVIPSVREYCEELDSEASISTLRASYEFRCKPPVVAHEAIREEFQKHETFELPPFELATLAGPHLCSHGMYLLTSDRSAAFEESTRSRRKYLEGVPQTALKRYPITPKPGTYFLALDKWGYDYYFHWMVETLSRFLALDELPDDVTIIMPRKTEPYMLRSLELFGIGDRSRMAFFDDTCWQLETCHFATKPYGWFLPSAKEVRTVSERILANGSFDANTDGPTRLYVSRGKCTNRRLVNEEAMKDHLESAGFTTYYPEDHALDAQIATFRQAEEIVASFGSGLTNVMFCKPGTKVTVFYDETYFDPCIWVLGECFDLDMAGIGYSADIGVPLEALASCSS